MQISISENYAINLDNAISIGVFQKHLFIYLISIITTE